MPLWFSKYCYVANAVTYVSAMLSVDEIIKIVLLILGCIQTIMVIIGKIIDWYSKAKADKKITAAEISEGIKILDEGIEDVKITIKDTTKHDEKP